MAAVTALGEFGPAASEALPALNRLREAAAPPEAAADEQERRDEAQ